MSADRPSQRATPVAPGYDEYGVAVADYPDCEHGADRRDQDTGVCCVPPDVAAQRRIDADPDAHGAAVNAMLDVTS